MQIQLLKTHFDPEEGISVLDLGTEYGHTGCSVRGVFPHATITGVEVHKPTFLACKEQAGECYDYLIHEDALTYLAETGDFFDVIIAAELIEHLPKDKGQILLQLLEKTGRLLIVTSPLGFKHQGELYGNPHQVHVSGWEQKEMKALGWETYALMPSATSPCSCAIYSKVSR